VEGLYQRLGIAVGVVRDFSAAGQLFNHAADWTSWRQALVALNGRTRLRKSASARARESPGHSQDRSGQQPGDRSATASSDREKFSRVVGTTISARLAVSGGHWRVNALGVKSRLDGDTSTRRDLMTHRLLG
jgi:hypothetical protein